MRWFADRAGTALVGALVAAGAVLVFSEDAPPKRLSDQWQEEREAIATQGWQVARSVQADLRGTGSPATILVLSARSPRCHGRGGGTPSQQLRVYDVEEGSLRLGYRYTPAPRGAAR